MAFRALLLTLVCALVAAACGHQGAQYGGTLLIDQPLLLSGSDSKVFDNLDITIRAPITVSGNATLTITNSRLTWDQQYHQQYRLAVQDQSRFALKNVITQTLRGLWINWDFKGSADISEIGVTRDVLWQSATDSVNFVADQSDIGLTIFGWSDASGNRVSATNSKVYYELIPLPGTYDFSLPNEGPVASWTASFLGNVSMTNSIVTKIDFDLQNATNITIRDSNNISIGWILNFTGDGLAYSTAGIQNRHYADQSWTVGDSTLRIVNTNVASFWPIAYGNFTWNISDSTMVDVRAYGQVHTTYSNCSFFSISGYDQAHLELNDSSVQNNALASGTSVIQLNHVTTDPSQFFYTLLDQGSIFRDGVQIPASTSPP